MAKEQLPLTPMDGDEESAKPGVVSRILGFAEHVVLVLVAVALIFLSILLLYQGVASLITAIQTNVIHDQAVNILDDILLVLMTMEIMYTVTLSIKAHRLQAEPFLVIGTIAAIRRILLITAVSSQSLSQPGEFQGMILELGLLCVIIIIMALSIFILRRSDCMKMQTQLAMKKQLNDEKKEESKSEQTAHK